MVNGYDRMLTMEVMSFVMSRGTGSNSEWPGQVSKKGALKNESSQTPL